MSPKSRAPGNRGGEHELAIAGARPVGRGAWALGLLLAACLFAYANAWRSGFVSDDQVLRAHLADVSATRGWASVFSHEFFATEGGGRSGFYRPLASLSLLVEQALYGAHPLGYHLTNFILHVLATWLVYALSLRTRLPVPAALGAAALFAVHPVHVEAVAWISGRPDLLCAASYLLSLWLFAVAHTRRSAWRFGLALAAGAAALLSKEMALTLPAAILLADLLGVTRALGPRAGAAGGFWADNGKGAFVRVMPFVALLAVYLLVRSQVPGLAVGRATVQAVPALERALTFERAVLYYLGLLLWPATLNAYPSLPPVASPLSGWFLGGALVLAGLVVVAWRARRVWPALAWGVGFLLIGMAPLTNAVAALSSESFRFPVAERYLYLPSAGFVVALAAILWEMTRRLGARHRATFVGAVALLGVLGAGRSLARNPVWRSDETLFEATLGTNPESAWAHVLIGALRFQQGRFAEARAAYDTALRLQPRSYAATLDMARLYDQEKQYDAAAEWYGRAMALEPRSRDAHLGLAAALRRLGRLEDAERHYALVVASNARDSEALVNQGELFMALGWMDAARRNFERAIQVNPRRKEAHYNLALYHLQHGEPEEAEGAAGRALALDGRYMDAYLLLGSLQVNRGDYAGAARRFEEAVAIDSSHAQARVNLGAAYLDMGDYARAIVTLQAALRHGASSQAYLNLGLAEERSGDTAAAGRSFREALRLDPGSARGRRELGLLLADEPGRGAEARELLTAPTGAGGAGGGDPDVEAALERLRAGARHTRPTPAPPSRPR